MVKEPEIIPSAFFNKRKTEKNISKRTIHAEAGARSLVILAKDHAS